MLDDLQIRAYANFIALLDVIDEHGDHTEPILVLDAIDDIFEAEFPDMETLNMIRALNNAAREWELDDPARKLRDHAQAVLDEHKDETE